MTRAELSREIDGILREGGRLEAQRRRILHAADSYAAAEAERICRPSAFQLEEMHAAARARRRLSKSEREAQ